MTVDFGPRPIIRRLVRAQCPGAQVIGVDRDDLRWAALRTDAERLPLRNSSVDLIVCLHVLEHVSDDRSAMSEIARVLSPHGVAIVQVPFRPTVPTDEDLAAGPDERAARFGQIDHVRWYGPDIIDRLSGAGLAVEHSTAESRFGSDVSSRVNVPLGDPMWLCRRRA